MRIINGTDTVSYTVEDTVGNTDTAEFEISVTNIEDKGGVEFE